MASYMKGHFAFYGIKSPRRKELLRQHVQQVGWPPPNDAQAVAWDMWQIDEREMQYVALTYLARVIKRLPPAFADFLEQLIVTKSWWDTVDGLAPIAGTLFLQHPSLQPRTTDGWLASDHMWLQRSAILHQLKYREQVDWPLLQRYILTLADHPDFFIRKASGWALRQYSKYRPDRVQQFVAKHELSGLTRREALKVIQAAKRNT